MQTVKSLKPAVKKTRSLYALPTINRNKRTKAASALADSSLDWIWHYAS